MKKIKVFAVTLSTFLLISCGGGGSSGGGGGTESGTVYKGAVTVTHSGPIAHPKANGTFPLRIVLTENTVTIGDPSNNKTAPLASDGSFTLTINGTFWDENIKPCKINTTFSGKVVGNLVTGTASSNGPCVYDNGDKVPHTSTGTFTSAP
jgi:hypothetical protein